VTVINTQQNHFQYFNSFELAAGMYKNLTPTRQRLSSGTLLGTSPNPDYKKSDRLNKNGNLSCHRIHCTHFRYCYYCTISGKSDEMFFCNLGNKQTH